MNEGLSATERERLVKLLGMLGSDHDGERASAGLLAARLLRDKGLTWTQVISSGPSQTYPRPQASPWQPPTSTCPSSRLGDMRLALNNLASLSEWERDFVRSIAQRPRWSPKQAARFAEVVDKVRSRTTGGGR